MNVFWVFVRKEFQHLLRDKRSMFILMGLPLVMMLLFGFALSSEVKESNIAVLDSAQDEASQMLIDRLDQSRYFEVAKVLRDEKEIETVFKRGEARLVVIFPNNFQHDLHYNNQAQIRLVGDATDPNTSSIVINYASAIIGNFQQDVLGDEKLPMRIETELRMLYNPQLKSAFNFVPGVMTLILMLLGAMMTSVSIVKEKELGTMEILLVSPMKPIWVVLSKAVPYIVLCMLDLILILLMAVYVLEMPIAGSLVLLMAESLLFILTALSLGLLISANVESQQVAMFISLVGLLMPSLVFSGFMFPIENMPKVLQVISNLIPTKWYYSIVKNVMVKGLGFSFVAKQTFILLGMTVFFLALAIKRFKVRLQ
ncbi:ABC transporter permease [Marinilongibacter aquaticus]|uniref:ABC transporter permease n=1 Tax=Marinilongibacter aquaticus TaxID=2975157 RepID=UPI0021BDA38D|nr:ABC transporter permease [Marinilongibacter aquaticus]UBM60890.1 ABC transporter permease [Marinilongibacter aquaticus]